MILPGVLKNAIDWVIGTGEIESKIVAITASVPHPDGGRRGLQALRDTLGAVSAVIVGGEPIARGPTFEALNRAPAFHPAVSSVESLSVSPSRCGVRAMVLGLSGGLFGCNVAELTPAGAEVATSSAAPVDSGFDPSGCRSLGYLVGRGGGSFGGGWMANEDLVAYAMNDLRNQAAALGANFIQHDSPQMGVSGNDKGTTTSTATVSGTAYVCSARKGESGVAMSRAGEAAAPVKSKSPPSGAAGFTFGSSKEDAEAACREKHEWVSSSEDSFGCSGTPRNVGATAVASLKFCDDSLCKIDLVVVPESQKSDEWLDAFVRLQKSLEKKYGAAAEQKKKLPSECRGDILACLREGNAWLRQVWEFEDRTTITLRMSNKPGPDPAIRVSYAKEAATEGPAL